MLKSIVLGANGQDGSYLCESLAARGHHVIAAGRQTAYTMRKPDGEFRYRQVDLRDQHALRQVLTAEKPDNIFHVAAVHGEAGFRYEEVVADLFAVSVLSVYVCLEYLRQRERGQLFYASSAKVFGEKPQQRITELSEKHAGSLYATAKIAAGNLIDCYRRDHGISATVAYFFNHESPRRGPDYFVPKIARALANGLSGNRDVVTLQSLDFFADWGSAREYMEMSAKAMEMGLDGDYVVATGETVWAAAAVEAIFKSYKLDYRQWLRAPEVGDPAESVAFVADPSKFTSALGYKPRLGFPQLVEEIVASIRQL